MYIVKMLLFTMTLYPTEISIEKKKIMSLSSLWFESSMISNDAHAKGSVTSYFEVRIFRVGLVEESGVLGSMVLKRIFGTFGHVSLSRFLCFLTTYEASSFALLCWLLFYPAIPKSQVTIG